MPSISVGIVWTIAAITQEAHADLAERISISAKEPPMSTRPTDSVLLALHYQNENCHPEGKIKVGIAEREQAWRADMLAAAKRLVDGARTHGVPIIHVRLAVRPDYRDVIQNAPLFRQWVELDAWKEGTWGVEFHEGLGPAGDELVVTHIRNNAFFGSPLETLVAMHEPRRLICAGVSTAYAVESTVRHASDLGYEVVVAADACSTATRERHESALQAMALIATISDVDEIVRSMAAAARSD
jgi:biuret amidohydrolase